MVSQTYSLRQKKIDISLNKDILKIKLYVCYSCYSEYSHSGVPEGYSDLKYLSLCLYSKTITCVGSVMLTKHPDDIKFDPNKLY